MLRASIRLVRPVRLVRSIRPVRLVCSIRPVRPVCSIRPVRSTCPVAPTKAALHTLPRVRRAAKQEVKQWVDSAIEEREEVESQDLSVEADGAWSEGWTDPDGASAISHEPDPIHWKDLVKEEKRKTEAYKRHLDWVTGQNWYLVKDDQGNLTVAPQQSAKSL